MTDCGIVDDITGAVCTLKEEHIGDHVDMSVEGISLAWPNTELRFYNHYISPASSIAAFAGVDLDEGDEI